VPHVVPMASIIPMPTARNPQNPVIARAFRDIWGWIVAPPAAVTVYRGLCLAPLVVTLPF
jgi:hypothetical protein